MSIVDSKDEREAARAKLADATDESLVQDLAYWTVAAHDHHQAYDELSQRRSQVGDLYNQASTWVGLVGAERHRRRMAGREPST